MDRPRQLRIVSLIVAVTVALDQLSKWWAETALDDGNTIGVLPTVEFDLTHNSGFSFSAGSGNGEWIGLLVTILVGFLIWQIWKATDAGRALIMALILGGAIGNLIDRVFRADDGPLSGRVVDFIDVSWYAVFNIADIFVVCGSVAFVIYELRSARSERESVAS